MVLCCCICKISFGEVEHLSFHSLPSNESSKVKWLSAINKTVSKSSRVCSRHFKSTDFKYKIQNGKICKSLTSDAVPSLMLNTSSEAENIEPTTPDTLDSSSNILCENLLLATSSSTDLQNNQECFQSCQNICDKESHNEDSQTDNEVITLESRSENPIDSLTAALSPNTNPVSLKRRNSNSEFKHIPKRPRHIRYIGDVTRDDFTSDQAFLVVEKYYKETKNKLKLKDKNIGRLKKKVSTFEDLLDHLKEVGLISKEGLDALKLHSSPALPEIMKNILSTKKCNFYSPALKDFACSLLFYSSAAYKFVRDQFLKALPCPQTVRRWFGNIHLGPGISKNVLISLKNMIEAERLNGKELQFGLQLDEMSVKKLIELKHNVWYGLVDIGGLGKNNSEEASYALVAMLVCLNGHFKTPVAYYFIKSLCGQARSNMLQEILLTLHENGISDVRSVTFDGASSNLSMVSELGANTTDIDQKCSFEHPATNEPVIVIPDACHMIKLVRNTLAKYDFIDSDKKTITWRFIVKLVNFQEQEGTHPGTKIRRRHIDFYGEKMKVKLAVQTLSTRVSDALKYLEMKSPDFSEASATALFCKNFNDAFDILNSRCRFGKTELKNGISKLNLEQLEKHIDYLVDYIKYLKVNENGKIKDVLASSRRIGFWGIITGLKNVLNLSRYLFQYKLMDYLLTYKLSRDHLETFFSCIRKMGGFNNNPTCYQFQASYKKLVSHVNTIEVSEGNCSAQDGTEIIRTKNFKSLNARESENIMVDIDHDYVGSNDWSWTDYHYDVVTYIAGCIVYSIKKTLHCQMCLDCLETQETSCDLINIKNRQREDTPKSGLVFPSQDVVSICKVAKKIVRMTPNLFSHRNIVDNMVLRARRLVLPMNIFSNLHIYVEKDILFSHKAQLVDNILKNILLLGYITKLALLNRKLNA